MTWRSVRGSCRRDLLDPIVALNECHLSRLLPNMFVTIIKSARISDLRRRHLTAGSFRRFGSRPFTRATRRAAPSLQSTRLARIDFPSVLYVIHALSGSCPPESFMLYRGDNRIQTCSTKHHM